MKDLFPRSTIADKLVNVLKFQRPYRFFYRGVLPKFLRHAIDQKLDFYKQQRIREAWYTMLQGYFANELENFVLKPKKKFENQKIIWQFWGGEEPPEAVQICFNSVDKYAQDYQIIRLNDENFRDYIDLPEFVFEKRHNPEFKYAFFTDLLRLALLDVYGGIWMDATILLTAPLPDKIKKLDFFMFQRDNHSPNKKLWGKFHGYFNWNKKHSINCLNSFIVGNKNNLAIHICLNMLLHFWKKQNNIPHYFFFQIMFDVLCKEYGYKADLLLDDTIPHLLQRVIEREFNPQHYQQILNQTSIHKLTYTQKYKSDSYFAYLKREFL